ncbi:MAG: hypothetical protein J0I80_02390 [Sphingomonas sp.]|nr:hypothetical protein [Sphingomonas sp.]
MAEDGVWSGTPVDIASAKIRSIGSANKWGENHNILKINNKNSSPAVLAPQPDHDQSS